MTLRFGCAPDIDLSEQAACAPCGGAGLLANHIDLDMVEIDRSGSSVRNGGPATAAVLAAATTNTAMARMPVLDTANDEPLMLS